MFRITMDIAFVWFFFLLWLLNLLVVVKLNRITLHTRLEKTSSSPTMDGIVLVMVDGLMHGAKNEPMISMLEDQVELSANLLKKLMKSKHYKWTIVISCTICFSPRWSI